jgi:hypothetical protein
MEAMYSSETPVDFHGVFGIISQKMELFFTLSV